MTRRSQPLAEAEGLRKRLLDLLEQFERHLQGKDLRQKVRALIPAFHAMRDLGASLVPVSGAAAAAQERIVAYLQRYPFKVIDGDELMVVSGIQEWARRVRELRVESGWWIYSGITFQQIQEEDPDQAQVIKEELGIDAASVKPDQYVLMRVEQDRDAAFRWNQLNKIRREGGGVIRRILKFLRLNAGKAVAGEELAYLAGGKKEWARRVRELRTEQGWPIATRQSGRPDLAVGVYVLEEDRQAEPHDRNIPDAVRVQVLERDSFACRKCRWTMAKASPADPRKILELHHIKHHKAGGANVAENLLTLCNVHHDDVHAGRLPAKSIR